MKKKVRAGEIYTEYHNLTFVYCVSKLEVYYISHAWYLNNKMTADVKDYKRNFSTYKKLYTDIFVEV